MGLDLVSQRVDAIHGVDLLGRRMRLNSENIFPSSPRFSEAELGKDFPSSAFQFHGYKVVHAIVTAVHAIVRVVHST